jgi:hypothetical protein
MPPEMTEKDYGFSVDIWTLGIVILEIFLGRIICGNEVAFMDSKFPDKFIS